MNRFQTAFLLLMITAGFCAPSYAEESSLKFTEGEKGFFAFNTGIVKGVMRADGKSQGIPSIVHIESGQEIAYGGTNPGLLSMYRVFSRGKRYGDAARDWPVDALLLSDGSLRLTWPAADEHPFEIRSTFSWVTPSILDTETDVTPREDLKDFEVFTSSYFNNQFESWVYVRPTVHNGGEASFMKADVSPLLAGTYFAFPRGRKAAQILYDGRWDFGPHPVDFSLPRFYAAPIGMRKNPANGLSIVQMSTPEDCFAVETPYNMNPPDGIAGHASLYFSLFGYDVKAGQSVKARSRMMIGTNLTEEDILDVYRKLH